MHTIDIGWVIDTSSLITLHRESNIPINRQHKIFEKLSEYVRNEKLFYPNQVVKELARKEGEDDMVYLWAKENEAQVSLKTPELDSPYIQNVVTHPQVFKVIDTEKVTDVDEADPYILAMAMELKNSKKHRLIAVITQETRDLSDKLSLNSACGLLEIVSLPIVPFLEQQSLI